MTFYNKIVQTIKSKAILKIIGALMFTVIAAQSVIIGKMYSEQNDKTYEVNRVKINTQKDSVDYLEMKNKLSLVDQTVRELNSFLAEKNLSDARISMLAQDSISNAVYLARQTNRYTQYLIDLQNKLQQVPLGIPTDGYISSNFGKRVNPIPPRNILMASAQPLKSVVPEAQYSPEKDSLGNVIASKKPNINATAQKSDAAEAKPIQFHKGMDIAVPYGTDVRAAARGTVIFAGAKGGYGNCVIISHGNGLATLYGHLSTIKVKANDVIEVNEVIAKSGNSGRSTGPHLHYEVHKNNTPVNPKLFVNL